MASGHPDGSYPGRPPLPPSVRRPQLQFATPSLRSRHLAD